MCWFAHDYCISRVIDMGDIKVSRFMGNLGLMEKITRGYSIQRSCRSCGRSTFNTKYSHELTRAELAEVTFRLDTQKHLYEPEETEETDHQPLLGLIPSVSNARRCSMHVGGADAE